MPAPGQDPPPLIEETFEDTLAILRRSGPAALAVAVRRGGELPSVRTVGHHPADVAPLRLAVRDQLGIDAVVLDCRSVRVADGVVRRLLVLESLDDGTLTPDLTWVGSRLSTGPPGPPDGRDWVVPGWWLRATAWITRTVQRAGLGRVLAIEQLRAWEFSCVLQVRTEQADLYFKALPYSHAREPPLVEHLATAHPEFVPKVVATSTRERWLLMRSCRGRCLKTGAPPSAWERAAAAYAQLQVASTAHAQRLRALGCQLRGPLELRALLGPLLADEPSLLGPGEHGLSVLELDRLRRLRPSLEAACGDLADSGIPAALEHGDLWSSNVYVGEDEAAFIDWTDACLSHPFFSLMPLLRSARWDLEPTSVHAVQARMLDRYLEHWTPYLDAGRLRHALALARPLAALHIATTYWRGIPQPHTQWWMPRLVPFFARMALEEGDAL